MRLSRTDLVPVLAIVTGGVIGASLSFSFLARSPAGDVQPVVPDLRYESVVTLESVTRDADRPGTVTGRVVDATTGASIAAVQVHISSLRMGGLTQQDGRYVIQNVPAGTHTLSVDRIGYRTAEMEITVDGDRTVNLSIAEEALGLSTIVIPGPQAGSQRRAIGSVVISVAADWVDRSEVERSGPIFTPMTVRPEIENLSEVREALMGEYPPQLRDDRIGGEVEVWFFISEEGRVLDSRISQPSAHTQLNEAALKVAEVLQFTPALNRNARVQLWVRLPIVFVAQD